MEEKIIKLGTLTIKGFAALAPMAGVADRSMRELCREFGTAFCIGELASAKGIAMQDKKSAGYLRVAGGERPMGVQLFGCEPEAMASAARAAQEYKPDFIDINMGCPAPKVALSGSGSALMKNPALTRQIVRSVVSASQCPVTVKMRSGWDDENKNAVQIAKICQGEGAAMITVHGRTRKQQYAPPTDHKIIADVKKAVTIPVIGNGDITGPEAAAEMYNNTGCDMVMVGRAANGAPWIFSKINAYLKNGALLPDPSIRQKMAVLLRQAELMQKYKDTHVAMLQIRKHAAWYIKGLHGAAALRERCGKISRMEDLELLVKLVLAAQEA